MSNSYAKGVIIDRNAPKEAIKKLVELNITPILSAKIPNIISEVSTHPDMQIHPLNDTTFVCEPTVYDYYTKALSNFNVKVLIGSKFSKLTYPDDVAYNVARIGDNAVHNVKYTDNVILDYYRNNSLRIIDVKQGYSKCSICPVNENAVITSDEGIGRVLENYGFEVLKVSNTGILLNKNTDGFIGGTCGFIGENKIAFCGDLNGYVNGDSIISFLSKHKVDIILLCKTKLQDIGSIIPIN